MKRAALAICATLLALATIAGLELFAEHRVARTAWNIRGYRGAILGARVPGELRIATIGGSTTFGYTVEAADSYPAQLEQILRAEGRNVRVANLGHLSDSSVCYEPTYQSYRYLNPDLVILYEGYNDVKGGTRRTERDCYRNTSAIFRATGFFPVLPIYAREHWYQWRYGSITKGYELARAELAATRPASNEAPYAIYERNVLNFVRARLAEQKDLIFAAQPYLGDPQHLEQQTKIRAALQPFFGNPHFRYRSFMYLFGGKWSAEWFSERMWLNARGNRALAKQMAAAVDDVRPEPALR